MNAEKKTLALNLLHDLDMVILERTAPGCYQFYGIAPDFYSWIFPSKNGMPCTSPWLHSSMLDFFLHDAEDFFNTQQQGNIDSGIWLEEVPGQDDIPLLATARYVGHMQVITVQCVRHFYRERARILQQARSELLKMEKLHRTLAAYKAKSLYDALTSLYNRGAFEDILNVQLNNRRQAQNGVLALMLLDMDNFKQINDSFGHSAGDAVLIQMGSILRDELRKEDVPARYAGEEFAVMAPVANLEQAVIVSEKIRHRVEKHDFGLNKKITLSIGATVFQPGEDGASLLHRADKALYTAKRAGRNQVCPLAP